MAKIFLCLLPFAGQHRHSGFWFLADVFKFWSFSQVGIPRPNLKDDLGWAIADVNNQPDAIAANRLSHFVTNTLHQQVSFSIIDNFHIFRIHGSTWSIMTASFRIGPTQKNLNERVFNLWDSLFWENSSTHSCLRLWMSAYSSFLQKFTQTLYQNMQHNRHY